jgi:hypothetical protein
VYGTLQNTPLHASAQLKNVLWAHHVHLSVRRVFQRELSFCHLLVAMWTDITPSGCSFFRDDVITVSVGT